MAKIEKKTIYELDLHEEVDIGSYITVLRVPGGWIYYRGSASAEVDREDGTFVPFTTVPVIPTPKVINNDIGNTVDYYHQFGTALVHVIHDYIDNYVLDPSGTNLLTREQRQERREMVRQALPKTWTDLAKIIEVEKFEKTANVGFVRMLMLKAMFDVRGIRWGDSFFEQKYPDFREHLRYQDMIDKEARNLKRRRELNVLLSKM